LRTALRLSPTSLYRDSTKRNITDITAGPPTGRVMGCGGMSGFPILELPVKPFPSAPITTSAPQHEPADAHLRSTQTVAATISRRTRNHRPRLRFHDGHPELGDSAPGHQTGHRFSGKEVQIPTREVARISYPDSTVFVNVTWRSSNKALNTIWLQSEQSINLIPTILTF